MSQCSVKQPPPAFEKVLLPIWSRLAAANVKKGKWSRVELTHHLQSVLRQCPGWFLLWPHQLSTADPSAACPGTQAGPAQCCCQQQSKHRNHWSLYSSKAEFTNLKQGQQLAPSPSKYFSANMKFLTHSELLDFSYGKGEYHFNVNWRKPDYRKYTEYPPLNRRDTLHRTELYCKNKGVGRRLLSLTCRVLCTPLFKEIVFFCFITYL